MSLLRNIARSVIPILLLVSLVFVTNITVNQHSHKLSSGLVVKHSHPLKQDKQGNPWQDHKHSSNELILLDHIYYTAFRLWLFFILLALFLTELREIITNCRNTEGTRFLFFLLNYHAPPLAPLSNR